MLLMSNQTPKIERIDDRSDPAYGKFVVERSNGATAPRWAAACGACCCPPFPEQR